MPLCHGGIFSFTKLAKCIVLQRNVAKITPKATQATNKLAIRRGVQITNDGTIRISGIITKKATAEVRYSVAERPNIISKNNLS